jgi:hypothetical protein
MGLDWNPLGKPKPGFEQEFERVFKLLGEQPDNAVGRDALNQRWLEIQITPYETLQAPQVGVSDAATEWALVRFAE